MRRLYGASPLHLLGHLVLLGVVVYVLEQIVGMRGWVNLLAWLLAGALLHDLVLLPLYSAADALLRRAVPTRVNLVRVPLAFAGLLALMFFPLILGKGDGNYHYNTGSDARDYAVPWVAISVGLLLAGAAAAARRWRDP